MRVRAQSADGDYTFGQGQANFLIDSPEAVAQVIKTRLLLMTGEWFLDTTDGTPYATQILGTGTSSTRDLAVKRRILQTPGVKQITSYSSSVVDRKFSVSVTVDTIYGQTATVEVAFP
jgi:hypothetical protein